MESLPPIIQLDRVWPDVGPEGIVKCRLKAHRSTGPVASRSSALPTFQNVQRSCCGRLGRPRHELGKALSGSGVLTRDAQEGGR